MTCVASSLKLLNTGASATEGEVGKMKATLLPLLPQRLRVLLRSTSWDLERWSRKCDTAFRIVDESNHVYHSAIFPVWANEGFPVGLCGVSCFIHASKVDGCTSWIVKAA